MKFSKLNQKDLFGLAIFGLITSFFVTLFVLFPKADILVSDLFYDDKNGFFLRKNPFIVFIYESIEYFIPALIIFCLISLVLIRVKNRKICGLGYSGIIYLLVALALGPGLLINGILKEFWGRARPATIQEFGGKLEFSPPLTPSDQCQSNCSFASGHASAGFFPVAMSFVCLNHRRKFFCAGIFYGLLTGFTRIVQGGHFLSDVIFAGLMVYGLSWLIWLFFDKDSETPC